MEAWDGWELGRAIVAFSALLYAGVWAQLSLMHWRAAFRRWEMYAPVFATPMFVLGILLGVLDREGLLGWVALIALAVGILEGLAGLYFHLRGVAYQVGGLFSIRNLMAGPPPVLPLAYSLVGVFGLMGLLWDA
jgi:hypothetical protein